MAEKRKTYSVLIISMSHNPEDKILIEGFPNIEAARLYARRYTWATVEEMKSVEGQNPETAFSIYGETAQVLEDAYTANSELNFFFSETPSREDIDWKALEHLYPLTWTYGD